MGTSPVAAMPLEVPLVRGVVREMRVSGRDGRSVPCEFWAASCVFGGLGCGGTAHRLLSARHRSPREGVRWQRAT